MDRYLKAKDIKTMLGIGNTTLYKLMAQPDFPAVKIGKCYCIRESDFNKWYERNIGKTIELV